MATGNAKILPKLDPIKKSATPVDVENFIQNLCFQLSQVQSFKKLVSDPDVTWSTVAVPNRGFEDDSSLILDRDRQTASEKCSTLNHMLGCIAAYIPVLSRTFLVNQTTSMNDIWYRLRVFYGCKRTGGRVLDITAFHLEEGESVEALWERMYAFVETSLGDPADKISHFGVVPKEREPFSETLLNVLVVLWLQAINPTLPKTVKQKYSKELQNSTLASLREDISMSIPALLEEEAIVSKIQTFQRTPRRVGGPGMQSRVCCLCKAGQRPNTDHFLSRCPFLPEGDRKFMTNLNKSRLVGVTEEEGQITEEGPPACRRVTIEHSPVLTASYGDITVSIIMDSGAEANLISYKEACRLQAHIQRNTQAASQADGKTPLQVVGECHLKFRVLHHTLAFSCLVVSDLGCPVLAGVPFHSANDVFVRMKSRTIHFGDCCHVVYDISTTRKDTNLASAGSASATEVSVDTVLELKQTIPPSSEGDASPAIHDSSNVSLDSSILRATCRLTILPGDSVRFNVPSHFRNEEILTIEPRLQSPSYGRFPPAWLRPSLQEVDQKDGTIEICNSSCLPVQLARNEQFCNLRRTVPLELSLQISRVQQVTPETEAEGVRTRQSKEKCSWYSDAVVIDPSGQLPKEMRSQFQQLHREFDGVFDPSVGLYNGYSGPFEAQVHMGKTEPPQRKGRVPVYSHSNLNILQDKFDDLEGQGVLATPESLGIVVEYVNPSFLVKKSNGGERMVTSFGQVAAYAKPQPSLMGNCDATLRTVCQWSYLVISDLSSAYHQIPLSRKSLKYCGVSSPFKGTLVYTRCAMGMPGSETALEQLLCTILGDLTAKGCVAKIADDLFCGGSTPERALEVWRLVLERLDRNGLRLSGRKTICCPTSATILGWRWNNGVISATPHRLSALEACAPPETVSSLRTFLGSYKFVGKVLPSFCDVLHPMEMAVANRGPKERIVWTDELTEAFTAAQRHLSKAKQLVSPRPEDELRIVTDASTSKRGLAATLYVIRSGRPMLAGFFHAKMKPFQTLWLTCEAEALCIGAAVSFFAPYIIQSRKQATVLTDSLPCVQAYGKFCRGEFSSSARVMTFLAALCNYAVKVAHIRGDQNLVADYTSRHPIECPDSNCQVCKFVDDAIHSVVREVNVNDILEGNVHLYGNRTDWRDVQKTCQDLKRIHAHLTQGTRPPRNSKPGDIRTYLSKSHNLRIANDGLLIVPGPIGMGPQHDRLVVPRALTHGIVTALHLKLGHPSKHQLRKVLNRQFFALGMDKTVDRVQSNCDICSGLQRVPTRFKEQSTSEPPGVVGQVYSADVARRCKQYILILRENITAYTVSSLIPDETGASYRDGIVCLVSRLRSNSGHPVRIRVDPAPGLRAIVNDKLLKSLGITMEIGDEKNPNKNPIAEHGISELHAQLTRLQPTGGPVSNVTLALATSKMNAEIRERGLSSTELWTKRNQFTGIQLPVSDGEVIRDRVKQRVDSHPSSAKYKSRGRTVPIYPVINVGDLVYLHDDRDKTKIRDRYIVIEISHPYCFVQKFCGRQLRGRRYRVSLCDCYPVLPSVVAKPVEPESDESDPDDDDIVLARGQEDDSLDRSDNGSETEGHEHDESDGEGRNDSGREVVSDSDHQNVLAGHADGEGNDEHAPFDVDNDNRRDDNADEPVVRGRRRRRRPVWSSDYVTHFADSDSESD